jgi:predicted Zn-dependent protease
VLARSPAAGELLLGAQINLAKAYVELRRPAQAVPILEELVDDLDDLNPQGQVALQYTLAQALWDSRRDRKRARALARRALAGLQALEGTQPEQITEIKRWLARHRAR